MHPNSDYMATGKALLESQLAAFSAITSLVAGQAEQALSMTLAVAKASTEASVTAAKQSLSANDPQALIALAAGLGKENAQRLTSYAGELVELRLSTRAELAKIATAQVADVQSKVHALVDDLARSAPVGAEHLFAFMKPASAEPAKPNGKSAAKK